MDILQQEILKKRKILEESVKLEPAKKYFRRAELLLKEEEDRLKLVKVNENPEAKQNPSTSYESQGTPAAETRTLPRKEVVRRLRERGEPVLLFGETELESFQRLRQCEILEPEVNKGLRNDFQEALDKVDQAFLDELVKSQPEEEGTNPKKNSFDVVVHENDITYEDIQSKAGNLRCGDRDLDVSITLDFLQLILKLWGKELNDRPQAEKRSVKGKLASATFSQTHNYLKPLFRKLKNNSLPEDILDSLTEIVRFVLDRNYIKANNAYLEMAIGNAPWPIGVTMVGIHARTGREKIFSKNVAHVLNDETQRKYIQGLKRLMTKAQQLFPTDPSRCVEYAAFV